MEKVDIDDGLIEVIDGKVNLTKMQKDLNPLYGKWKFYWGRFLKPEDIQKNGLPKKHNLLESNKEWVLQKGQSGNYPSFGFGTLALELKTSKPLKGIGFSFGSSHIAYESYLIGTDIIKLASSGTPGVSKDTEKPLFSNQISPEISINKDSILVFHISNFRYRSGNFKAPSIGNHKFIERKDKKRIILDFVVAGSGLIFALYHLGLFFRRRGDMGSFWFSGFCFSSVVRGVVANSHCNLFIDNITPIIFSLIIRLEYLSPWIMIIALFSFTKDILEIKKSNLIKINVLIAIIGSLVSLFAPLFYVTKSLTFVQLGMLIGSLSGFAILIVELIKKTPYAKMMGFGCIVLVSAVGHDLLLGANIIKSQFALTHIGTLAFFFLQAYILSLKFATAYETAEKLSKNLQDEVNKKTYELEIEKMSIQNMMDQTYEQKLARDQLLSNLSQGYLTFNKDGVILNGATKVTEELLEVSLFESEDDGLKIWDVLFKEPSKKDNFKKWIDKIFEARFSFRDLKQLAPKLFEGTEEKYIELEFRPIYEKDSKRKIDKMILIASDKTEEVWLQKKLEKDKESTEFINKCLQNPLEFVDLIFDSTTLIQEYKFDDIEDKGELFRKFHTLKARFGQFSLRSLTSLINNVETAISDEKFEKVKSSIERFDLELKGFVKNNRLIVEAANKFLVDEGNAVQVPEIIEKAKEFTNINEYIDFVKSEYLLSDLKTKFERYIPLASEIAERQGKAIDFLISGDKILVDTNKYSSFINSSIHLFRNMVDHGIESEDERIEKTKPQKGNIKVNFKLNGSDFEIQLQDDGQGIDPERVKEKAIEKGLKSENELSQILDENIVDIIFLPGFSTKEEVTDVSGRGVGMDAVREEVERLGGIISVSSKIDEGTTFVIQLPILS